MKSLYDLLISLFPNGIIPESGLEQLTSLFEYNKATDIRRQP